MSARNNDVPYVRGGNHHNVNESVPAANSSTSAYRRAERGQQHRIDGEDHIRVMQDTGATSATPNGLAAAGKIAYWKDRANYIVTNDLRFAVGDENAQAGVYFNAPTPGNETELATGRSRNITVLVDSSSFVEGDSVVSDTLANNTAKGTRVAKGTAVTSQKLGTALGAAVAGSLQVDLELPDFA